MADASYEEQQREKARQLVESIFGDDVSQPSLSSGPGQISLASLPADALPSAPSPGNCRYNGLKQQTFNPGRLAPPSLKNKLEVGDIICWSDNGADHIEMVVDKNTDTGALKFASDTEQGPQGEHYGEHFFCNQTCADSRYVVYRNSDQKFNAKAAQALKDHIAQSHRTNYGGECAKYVREAVEAGHDGESIGLHPDHAAGYNRSDTLHHAGYEAIGEGIGNDYRPKSSGVMAQTTPPTKSPAMVTG